MHGRLRTQAKATVASDNPQRPRRSCVAARLLRVRLTERALCLNDCAPDCRFRLSQCAPERTLDGHRDSMRRPTKGNAAQEPQSSGGNAAANRSVIQATAADVLSRAAKPSPTPGNSTIRTRLLAWHNRLM
jgi:hypothetical protein